MLSCLMGLWMATTLGQTGPEDAWLATVPADVPIVVRGKSLESVKGDLLAMVKAMSPNLGQTAEGMIGPGLDAIQGMVGPSVMKSPFLAMVRLPDAAQPGIPGWSVIVKASDYGTLLQELAPEGEKPKRLAGYDSFTSKTGQTWFAARGTGWVAFGPDESLIKVIGKPQSVKAKAASGDLKTKLMTGDLGIYINIVEIQKKFGPMFEQFKPVLVAQLQQANPAQAENATKSLDGVSQILKSGDGLVLSFDFDASALSLTGLATVLPGSDAAKALATSKVSTGELLGKLPSDLMLYVVGDKVATAASQAGANPAMGKATTSPEVEKATADRMTALEGRQVIAMSFMPAKAISLADPKDPKAAAKAALTAEMARKESANQDTTIKPKALTYKGFQFDQVQTKITEKMIEQMKAAQANVPNIDEIIKQAMPGNMLTSYSGSDGKYFLSSMAPSEAVLKAQVDSIQTGKNTLGTLPAWKTLRAKLPEKATVLVVVNAQEMVKMIGTAMGAATKTDTKPAAMNLPKATALFGFSLVNSPKGYDFRMIVPSDVGPVLEKGLTPLAGGMHQ